MVSCTNTKCADCHYLVFDPRIDSEVCVLAFNIPAKDGRGLMRPIPYEDT